MKQLFSILLIVAVVVVAAMAPGAAAGESPTYRIPSNCVPFHYFGPR